MKATLQNVSFLEEPRGLDYGWHVVQAKQWLDYDNDRHLDNPLVYASLELRCAIEHMFFEFLYILADEDLSEEEMKRCKSNNGLLALMEEKEPEYRKRIEFTNIMTSVVDGFPKVIEVDIRLLKRKWSELSDFCHKQLRTDQSWGSPQRSFQERGYELCRDLLYRFRRWHADGALGIMSKKNMEPEGQEIYERFVSGELSAESARRQLMLAKPVFEARYRQSE